jgi:hypothetical protein
MPSTINASTSAGGGIIQTADASGILELQGAGVTVATATSTGFQVNTYSPAASLITSSTAQATTSGTFKDFTGIPSWVKRITVIFQGVSTSGTSSTQIQLGAGSVTTTGYLGTYGGWIHATAPAAYLLTTGFGVTSDAAADIRHGSVVLTNLSSNIWTCSGVLALSNKACQITTAGSITLGGTLDRVRITTINGTDTFDAGSINIMYE